MESPFDPPLSDRRAGLVVYPPPKPTVSLNSSGVRAGPTTTWARRGPAGRQQAPRSKSRIRRPVLRERTFLEVTVKRSSLDQILITEASGVVPTQFRAHEYPEDPVAAIRYSPGYPIGETLPAGLIIGVGPAKFLVRFLPKTHRGFASATISIRVGVATPGAAGGTSRSHRICSEILPVMTRLGVPMRYHVSCGRICLADPALTWKETASHPSTLDIRA